EVDGAVGVRWGVDGRGRPSYGKGVTDLEVRPTDGRRAGKGQTGEAERISSLSAEGDSAVELNLSVLDDLFADLGLLP
ncbi:MAG: hypothetical protein RLZZ458_412, partial [Planctomycetota bacterium]